MTQLRIEGLHHVGVVVDDLADAARLLGDGLGLEAGIELDTPELQARYFECGNASIEAIELRGAEARAGRLGDAPARIDHVALAVADLDATLAALSALGIETTPVRDSAGRRTCWTVAATSDGISLQFLETG